MGYLDPVVAEVHHAQSEAMSNAAYPGNTVVAHVEGFKVRRKVSAVHRLHSAEKIVTDVQVPKGRHGRQDGHVQHLRDKKEKESIVPINTAVQPIRSGCMFVFRKSVYY